MMFDARKYPANKGQPEGSEMVNKQTTSPTRPRSDLGLPQHRGQQGVSLEQIADRTKISIRFLRAIESEDFTALPGGIFSKSYIRQYAAAVDYDADRLLARYRDCTGDAGEDRAEIESPSKVSASAW